MVKNNMNLLIKIATSKDYNKVLQLSLLLNDSEPKKEDKIKQAIDNSLVWITEDENKIIGYCLVELFDNTHEQLPDSIFISELFVSEPYRKQGIGKKLIQQVLQTNFPAKYKYFSLSHDPKEIYLTKFYKSLGFEVVGKTKGGNVKMIKKICYKK